MRQRSNRNVRPELEQAESRALLSALGCGHGHGSPPPGSPPPHHRFGAVVGQAYEYYLTQSVGENTPIYSTAIVNETNYSLQIQVTSTTTGGANLQGNLPSGYGTLPNEGELLLFTNNRTGSFTVGMSVTQNSNIGATFAIDSSNAKQTSEEKGFGFEFLEDFSKDVSLSAQNEVVLTGSPGHWQLKLQPVTTGIRRV